MSIFDEIGLFEQGLEEGKVIRLTFQNGNWSVSLGDDIEAMSLPELEAYRDELYARLDDLDSVEPSDMESDEYSDWADTHEELEDLIDDVIERIESL